MSMSRMRSMAVMLAASFGVLAEAGRSAGESALAYMASAGSGPTFGQRYGSNPRSTGNGGNGRGAVARMKRAKAKRRAAAKSPRSVNGYKAKRRHA